MQKCLDIFVFKIIYWWTSKHWFLRCVNILWKSTDKCCFFQLQMRKNIRFDKLWHYFKTLLGERQVCGTLSQKSISYMYYVGPFTRTYFIHELYGTLHKSLFHTWAVWEPSQEPISHMNCMTVVGLPRMCNSLGLTLQKVFVKKGNFVMFFFF